jgi:molybdopterin converting factor small subunit
MVLTVKLFATFQDGRFEIAQVEKLEGAKVVNVVDDLRIPQGEVGILMVHGRHVEFDTPLHAGDVLAIFPKIGGG